MSKSRVDTAWYFFRFFFFVYDPNSSDRRPTDFSWVGGHTLTA